MDLSENWEWQDRRSLDVSYVHCEDINLCSIHVFIMSVLMLGLGRLPVSLFMLKVVCYLSGCCCCAELWVPRN